MITVETITRHQIETLQLEAAQAGDNATVHYCILALGSVYDSASECEVLFARERLCKTINNTRAMCDND